jgi:hypothetical protein
MEDETMQAILTKYIGPTNTRGARVKASTEGGATLTVGWNHEVNHDENHRLAAFALAKKLNWVGKWAGGGTKTGAVYVCETHNTDTFTIAKGE